MTEKNLEWMEESVEKIEKNNGFYKFLCFFLGRKMKYKELYMLLSAVNRKSMGEEKAKQWAFLKALKTYKFLNDNKMPEGLKI